MTKFKILCPECNNDDISIVEDIDYDYDYDEEPYVCGYYLECNKCGAIDDEH